MKLYISTGNSRMEKKWNGQEMEFSVFLERLSHTVRTSETMEQYRKLSKAKQDSIKDVGGFVLGKLKGGRRKKANVLFRSGLTLDMDYATEDIAEQIELFFDFRCLIYSTHKHTPEKPRLRLIIPLSRTVSPDEYAAVARKVAEDIGMELFDDTTYEPSRLMYWPSTSADGEFFFRDIPGTFLNPDSVLERYADWRDSSSWPVSSRQKAVVTNKAQECYAVLDEIFMKETGMGVPNEYVAVLIKAMLAHGASWNGWDRLFQGILGISGNSAKNALHRYLGYGEPDVERVKECTKEQVTLIGFGDIAQDKAFIYSIPIPIEFHEKSLKRKLTVTLAYLSPIHPSSIKYREKQVWVTINNGNSLIGSRAEYDYHAVQRGTLQHEIFENDSIEVWDIDQSIELKVNCRGCASENNPEMLIPYALFATFEMAPDCGVDVYQKVVDKVQVKNAIKTV